MDVTEVRKILERAKCKKEETEAQRIKDEIDDVRQKIKFTREREKTLRQELEKLRKYRQSLLDERREVEEYKEHLTEDYEKMCNALGEEIRRVDSEIVDKENQALEMEKSVGPDIALLDKLMDGGHSKTDKEPPKNVKKQEVNDSCPQVYFDKETEELAKLCDRSILLIFEDIKELTVKMAIYEHNEKTRYLLLKKTSAKWRLLNEKPNVERVRIVLGKCRDVLGRLGRQYVNDHVEALDSKFTTNWSFYLNEAVAQWERHLRGEPEPEKKTYSTQKINFGVVIKANEFAANPKENKTPIPLPVSVPTTPTPIHLEVPRPVRHHKKAKEQEEKPEEILPPEVLDYTKGKKVAVLAGLASKNEPIREWMERHFQFKDVKWYDKNARVLLQTLGLGAIDLLVIFPKWYDGWPLYRTAAKKSGVKTIMMNSGNKKLISQEIMQSIKQN